MEIVQAEHPLGRVCGSRILILIVAGHSGYDIQPMADADSARKSQNLDLMLLAAAALGAVLVLARQVPYGVGLHWDSGNYVAAARYLLAGEGFRQYSGATYVSLTPLYPLLLAVGSFDVLDPLKVAGPVNAALFGITIFVVGQYLRRRLESRFLAVWAALTIALAAPLAGPAAVALTGAAFILLVTLTLINTDAFLAKGRTSSLVWAGVCAALAWQTRYAGGALLAAVAVMLLLLRGAQPVQRVQRVRRAAGFLLLAGAPMALWLVRNRVVSGTFTGGRGGEVLSLPVTLSGAGEVLRSWAAFDLPLVEWQAVALLGLLPAVALAAACVMLVRGRWQARTPSDWLPCFVFGGFALAFFTVLAVSLTLGGRYVEPRFLAPLYVPLLLTAVFALDRLLGGRAAPRTVAAVVTAVLCVWTAGQIEPNVREVRRANAEGAFGYASPFWAHSETVEWIRQNQLEGHILSNAALVVSIHNYASARPAAAYRFLPTTEEHLEELLQSWLAEARTFYVVWFEDEWLNRSHEYGNADLHESSHLEPIAELADGTIFKAASAAD